MDLDNQDIEKLINEEESSAVFADIMDSFYSLTGAYSDYAGKVKNEKRKDEKKKADELEMQGIKEDIERRYTKQFESALIHSQNPQEEPEIKPVSVLPQVDISEELNSIDSLIDNIDTYIIKPPEKKETQTESFDLTEKNAVYACVYIFGDCISSLFSEGFKRLFKALGSGAKAIFSFFRSIKRRSGFSLARKINNFVNEGKSFKKAYRSFLKILLACLKHPLSFPAVISHYSKKGIKKHSHFIKTAGNFLAPVAAAIVLLCVINYQSGLTFALNVFYNGESVGFVKDESVVVEAGEKMSGLLYSQSEGVGEIQYGLTLISLDEMDDSDTVCDKMLSAENSDLTNACGIYVDDEFICAVKNEADAKTVFYSLLEPYEQEAAENGYSVSFAQSIDYVQGLYPQSTVKEPEELKNVLTGASDGKSRLQLKKAITSTSIAQIPYSTVKQRDLTKYSGYRFVKQKGENGTQRVTAVEIYINGIYQGTEYSYETITEPVNEIIIVGSLTSYNGVYIGEASSKGFLWPAPHCRVVSSPYGWRSSGWHKGIDLCTGNGTAYGSAVIASRSGRVEAIQKSNSGYGHMVLINHGDGYKTRYAHMISGSIRVSVGEYVEAGQTIGKVGSTGNSSGPHLHFEVIYNGETKNPANYIK